MNSMQYTIRSITPKLDATLRARAKKTGKSLNEVVIEALEKGSGLSQKTEFHDLDWFIGSHTLDESFDEAMEWHDSLPNDLLDTLQ